MADRWDRLVEAVGEAALLEGAAAHTYLRDTLHDDPGLLAEAERILEGGTADDDFLVRREEPAPTAALVPGSRIGPYELLELLGQGGMGTVFRARQQNPDRVVALKILRSALLSPKARRRLEYEIQALASLRHPGIAQVYEAGIRTDDDGLLRRERPWFAMEYVENAATLLVHLEREQLSRDERLELFLQVCDAVQHGHQKGVVHRDLKPDNILVDGEGRAKVIDFGVAKRTDTDAPLTTVGSGVPEIVGTLPYLSPERVTGDRDSADVRTDVYALGVVLFQMLTGRFPIEVDPNDIVTSARRICREPPLKPSRVDAGLPKDLDAIVLKALAKDPEQRYASVEAVAGDVRRFLDALPIQARAPSLGYQLRLFARRNKVLVTAVGVVLAALVTATVVSLDYAADAKASAATATTERKRAEGVVETVVQRNIDNLTRFAPQINMLAGGPRHVARLMEAITKDLQELERLAEDDPRIRVLLARTYLTLGDTQGNDNQGNLNRPQDARVSYLRALELAQSVPRGQAARLTIALARVSLAELLLQEAYQLRRRRKSTESLQGELFGYLRPALADAEALHRKDPDDKSVTRALGRARARLGEAELEARDFDAAKAHAQAVLALDPERSLDVQPMGHNLLALTYERQRNWKDALAPLQRFTERMGKKATAPAATHHDRRGYATALRRLGFVADRAGDVPLAIASSEKMLALTRELMDEDPLTNDRDEVTYAIHLYDLGCQCGEAALKSQDAGRKRALYTKALAAFRDAKARYKPGDAKDPHAHGMAQGIDQAIAYIEKALAGQGD